MSFTQKDANKILEAIGDNIETPPLLLLARTKEAIDTYHHNDPAPRLSIIRAELNKISKAAKSFRKTLNDAHADTLALVVSDGSLEEVKNHMKMIDDWSKEAEDSLEILPPDPGGPPKDDRLDTLTRTLGRIFIKATGGPLTHTVNTYFDKETDDKETDPPENRFTSPFDKFAFAAIQVGEIQVGHRQVADSISKAMDHLKAGEKP